MGEDQYAHHALKNALRIGRQGEIRDRTAEDQRHRMAGLNLLAAIVIYWRTDHLGRAVTAGTDDGRDCPPELVSYRSPLGWAHILLTGEYRWPKRWPNQLNVRSCPLPEQPARYTKFRKTEPIGLARVTARRAVSAPHRR